VVLCISLHPSRRGSGTPSFGWAAAKLDSFCPFCISIIVAILMILVIQPWHHAVWSVSTCVKLMQIFKLVNLSPGDIGFKFFFFFITGKNDGYHRVASL
jgi:hypothetical protein